MNNYNEESRICINCKNKGLHIQKWYYRQVYLCYTCNVAFKAGWPIGEECERDKIIKELVKRGIDVSFLK
jgi:hypothetical protein